MRTAKKREDKTIKPKIRKSALKGRKISKTVVKSVAIQINIVGVFMKNNKAVAMAIQINPVIRNFFSPILSESLPKVYGKNTKGVSITVKIIPMVGQDKPIC